MGREDDWKEIEKTQENYEQGIKEQFCGVDIVKLSKDNKKSTHRIKKLNKKLDKLVKILLIFNAIFLSLIIILGTYIYITYLDSIKERVNIDAIADLKNIYGIKVKVEENNLDKYENGKYKLESKEENPIEFTLIKKFGSYQFDYYEHCLKRAYENSGEDIKSTFETHESYTDNGLLEYSITAKVSNLKEIDDVVDKFIIMRDNAGKQYNYAWDVYIQIENNVQKIISLGEDESQKTISGRIKCNYVVEKVNKDNTENLTAAEIERYYKPFSLKLFLNGEIVYTKYAIPPVQQNVLYDYYEEEYNMPIVCLEDVEGVQITYDDNNNAKQITYKNVTYEIQGTTLDLGNNIIPNAPNIETLEKILEVKFEFDLKKQTLNIVAE